MTKNEIEIFDIGDMSVGITSLTILKAELNEEFINFMKEEGTLKDFRNKLQNLVEEFMEPEIKYDNFMLEDNDYEEIIN